MNEKEAATLLGRTELFGDLPDTARIDLAGRLRERSFPRGDIIFHQGDPGSTLFVVTSGLLKVFLTSPHGGEMVLATLKPPDTLGELAVIDGGPRSASARAITATVLMALSRGDFVDLLRGHPDVAEALYRSLGRLLRRVLEQAADLVFLDLPGRVAKLIVTLSEDIGESTEEGMMLDLGVSQATLAGMVGGSRPTVNQILRAFAARDYLELRGRRILIREPDKLRGRAGL